MKKTLLIILVIIVIVLLYFGIRYYMCLASEGQICSQGTIPIADTERTGDKKYKCNFWKGKTCI